MSRSPKRAPTTRNAVGALSPIVDEEEDVNRATALAVLLSTAVLLGYLVAGGVFLAAVGVLRWAAGV